MSGLPQDLRTALAELAARARVLVGVDFDGTLSPFVTDPMTARAAPGGMEALRAAAELPGVSVAVVSGRDVATLRSLTGLPTGGPVVLVGSHGAQSSLEDDPSAPLLDDGAERLLRSLTADLESVASAHPGARVEHKPASVSLHVRGVDPAVAAPATAAAHEVGARHTGVHVMPGKDVVELAVLETSKGSALRALAAQLEVDATAYFGDDVTDERAFAALDPAAGDVTVKVGRGETAARHRVGSIEDVVAALELFVALRSS